MKRCGLESKHLMSLTPGVCSAPSEMIVRRHSCGYSHTTCELRTPAPKRENHASVPNPKAFRTRSASPSTRLTPLNRRGQGLHLLYTCRPSRLRRRVRQWLLWQHLEVLPRVRAELRARDSSLFPAERRIRTGKAHWALTVHPTELSELNTFRRLVPLSIALSRYYASKCKPPRPSELP